MDESIELVRDSSALGYVGRMPIVDRLLTEGWCSLEDLAFGCSTLRESDRPVMMAFFEVPFRIFLPDHKWLRLSSPYGQPYICFAQLPPSPNDEINTRTTPKHRSQVMVSFHLWGRRREFYEHYLAAVGNPAIWSSCIVSTEESWLSNRAPLTPATYEAEVATRLYVETRRVLKAFMPIYQLAARDSEAIVPPILNHYFTMAKNGRIVVVRTPEITPTRRPDATPSEDRSGNLKRLRAHLASGRTPSVYENYLLEAVRLAKSGAANLAVVYTVMILDWFANELIRDGILRIVDTSLRHAGKIASLVRERLWESDLPNSKFRTQIRTPEKFEKYLPAIGLELPERLQHELNEVIRLRNRIIHKTQNAAIEPVAAEHAIDVGMRVIEFCMQTRIELINQKSVAGPAGSK